QAAAGRPARSSRQRPRADLARAAALDSAVRARHARRPRGARRHRARASDAEGSGRDPARGAPVAEGLAERAIDHRARVEAPAPPFIARLTCSTRSITRSTLPPRLFFASFSE